MSIRLNYQEAALRVCVDDMRNGAFSGHIEGRRIKSSISFTDFSDFVIQVDSLLDIQQFPQAFQQIRSFTEKSAPTVPAVQTKDEIGPGNELSSIFGKCVTFSFLVISRMNATWQGYIDWLDSTDKQRFESTLEFLKLIGEHIKEL